MLLHVGSDQARLFTLVSDTYDDRLPVVNPETYCFFHGFSFACQASASGQIFVRSPKHISYTPAINCASVLYCSPIWSKTLIHECAELPTAGVIASRWLVENNFP
jgi:hypothetical protein